MQLPVAVARCKLVIYLVLQATVKKKEKKINTLPNLCKTGPGGKTNKLSRSQRRQQPKTNVGRSRNSTRKTQDEHRMQLVMVQFPFFFSLFLNIYEMPQGLQVAHCSWQLAGCKHCEFRYELLSALQGQLFGRLEQRQCNRLTHSMSFHFWQASSTTSRTTCNFQIWRNKCKAEKYLMDCVRTAKQWPHDVPEIKSTLGAGAIQEIASQIDR